MNATGSTSKPLPRSNTSVSLSGDEIHDIEEAARIKQQSRAEFIRIAAIAAAHEVLKRPVAKTHRSHAEAGR